MIILIVTLRAELVDKIDRIERNRSRFVTEAVERELERRRREGLLQSLASPHPDAGLAELGIGDWSSGLLPDDEGLVDESKGTPVRWVVGEGWGSASRSSPSCP